jgi:hypothetical protein
MPRIHGREAFHKGTRFISSQDAVLCILTVEGIAARVQRQDVILTAALKL